MARKGKKKARGFERHPAPGLRDTRYQLRAEVNAQRRHATRGTRGLKKTSGRISQCDTAIAPQNVITGKTNKAYKISLSDVS